MKFFWPVYLSSVAFGTVGIYTAAPLVRPYVTSAFKNDGVGHVSPVVAAAVPPAAQKAAVASSSEASVRPQAEPPLPAAAAQEEDETLPAVLGIYLASHGDRPGWGITNQRTIDYAPDGTRIGNVPGGLLFDAGATHKSTKGMMIECRFRDGGVTNRTVLVTQKDVHLFTGSYTNLSARQREMLKTYYVLNGNIETRKTDLLLASAAKNPYLAEANAAYKAYTACCNKARELVLQRDRAVDQERTRIEDQLHELKIKEVPLKSALDAANAKFRAWKQHHGGEVAKPESDPDIKKWRQDMEALRPRLPGLAF